MAKGLKVGRAGSPSGSVPGGAGHSPRQHPFAGPAAPGAPTALKKALSKKSPHGKITGYAGTVR